MGGAVRVNRQKILTAFDSHFDNYAEHISFDLSRWSTAEVTHKVPGLDPMPRLYAVRYCDGGHGA